MNSEANTKICAHLSPFLLELNALGSVVIRTDENSWSNCLLSVALDTGPTFAQAEKMFSLPAQTKLWHNEDTHYNLENGLFCEQCNHSLSWAKPPQDR
jgi:hypothetical protein